MDSDAPVKENTANSPIERLSPRHRRFVEEYIIDYNATAAYLRAGFRGTRETARRNAHVLLTNTDVDKAVKEAEQVALERVRIRQHEVFSELRNVAFSNVDDYVVDNEGNITLREDVDRSAYRAISSIQKKTTTRTRGEDSETTHDVKITLWNKNEALRMAGQTQGMFVDKLAPTSPDGKDEYGAGNLSDEERAERVATILDRLRARRDRPTSQPEE